MAVDRNRHLTKYWIAAFIILCYIFGGFNQFFTFPSEPLNHVDGKGSQENPLDGCLHVYLDMGTHRGIQIRKLYEPIKYPDSVVFPVFDQYFGEFSKRNLSEICAVGFEPNHVHTKILTETERNLRNCGWRVIIHQLTGVDTRDYKTKFARVPSWDVNDMAGRVAQDFGDEKLNKDLEDLQDVDIIRISRYINEVVATRKLPPSAKFTIPRVVMKLDVEGLEMGIVPDILMQGAAKHLDNLHIDYTHCADPYVDCKKIQELKQSMETLVRFSFEANLSHVLEITGVDDEHMSLSNEPWLSCSTL